MAVSRQVTSQNHWEADASRSPEAALADVVEQMADELRVVGAVDVEAWQARHPEFASELLQLVPTLGLLAGLSSSGDRVLEAAESYCERTLGDFRILRELGRGGMGIVYEAEQLSLNRRVALKILPTAAVLDPRTLQRFKNEAQAAAALDHPHIVDVYGVGTERGVHYYAMRLIDGCTVAELVADLRGVAEGRGHESGESKVQGPKSKVETRRVAGLTTFGTRESLRSQRFFRSVAELGMHVAEGLAHAHRQGVIHRDIKPSNLLLDGQGKVWLADFGLAHIEANPTLTASGDLLGTLRYMSPEQALANRVPVDHRTDIYSLGATLYELITLSPVFGESERAALVQKIASGEPTQPRKLNPRVPADLETILLRMLEKEAAARYATADDLAADLRRFVEDQPIHARRRSAWQRIVKWAGRNRGGVLAAAGLVLVLMLVTGGLMGWQWRGAVARRAVVERVAASALDATSRHEREGNWPLALVEVQRAEAALASEEGAELPIAVEVAARRRDAEMAMELDRVRLIAATIAGGDFDFKAADRAYATTFAAYGIDVEREPRETIVAEARRARIALLLADGLTNWGIVRMRANSDAQPGWLELVKLAKQVDPDPWRNRLREIYEPGKVSKDELRDLIERAPLEKLPRATLFLLVQAAGNFQVAGDDVEQRLQSVQRACADDFWINFATARYFEQVTPPVYAEAVRYYSAAVSLRPRSAAAHSNLGVALVRLGRGDEGAAAFERAATVEPAFVAAYANLGHVLCEAGKFEEAEHVLRRALAISDTTAEVHYHLGRAMFEQGRPEEAAAACRRALEMKPGLVAARELLEQCQQQPR